MRYENNFYLTHDKSQDIEFLFVDRGRNLGWRAYILTDIDYKGRNTLCTSIHRLTESTGETVDLIKKFMRETRLTSRTISSIHYICWSKPVYELDDMREVAKTWSEITAYYIKHGGSFTDIQKKLKSHGIISF